jgi:hypothetical protein
VTWHYQWIILHEFLPKTIGPTLLAKILRDGPQFYRPQDPVNRFQATNGQSMPRIPIEFSAAAYRFGHSQIRPSYRLNFGPTGGSAAVPVPVRRRAGSGRGRPERPARRQARGAPLHRLGNLLRFWRWQCPEQQADRHPPVVAPDGAAGLTRPVTGLAERRAAVAAGAHPHARRQFRHPVRAGNC